MNPFQLNYEYRLQCWYILRNNLKNASIKDQCLKVDSFWQQCPLVNHHLHPSDIKDWPNPWELLNENTYCVFSRALGIIYTLLLLGIKNIDLVTGKDNNNEDVVLVLVDSAKYILNYWPNTVVNNYLHDFTEIKSINIQPVINKIGIE